MSNINTLDAIVEASKTVAEKIKEYSDNKFKAVNEKIEVAENIISGINDEIQDLKDNKLTYDDTEIKDSISELKQDLDKKTNELSKEMTAKIDNIVNFEEKTEDLVLPSRKNGYVNFSNGFVTDAESFYHYEIPCAEGEIYKIINTSIYLSASYAIYNDSGYMIDSYPKTSSNTETKHIDLVVEIPKDGVLIKIGYISFHTDVSFSVKKIIKGGYLSEKVQITNESIADDSISIKKLSTDVQNALGREYSKEDIKSDWIDKIIYYNNSLNDGGKHAVIDVKEGEHYKIVGVAWYNASIYVLRDSSGNKISCYPKGSSSSLISETVELEIPKGATKLIINKTNNPVYETKVYKSINVVGKTADDVYRIGNVLYGKKYQCCGDSFTQGDFTGYTDAYGNTGTNSDAYDGSMGVYKTYPWWIAKRNGMTLKNIALSGSDLVNISGATNPFSNTSSFYNYTKLDADADYITIAFGLNEHNLTAEQIGTKTDTTNATLWGCYNIIFEYLLTQNPFVKIGVIIQDAWMTETYANAVKEICKWWGIKYLDLKFGDNVPAGLEWQGNSKAKQLRDNAWHVSTTNIHPNLKAHEYRSTIIEDFLRSL